MWKDVEGGEGVGGKGGGFWRTKFNGSISPVSWFIPKSIDERLGRKCIVEGRVPVRLFADWTSTCHALPLTSIITRHSVGVRLLKWSVRRFVEVFQSIYLSIRDLRLNNPIPQPTQHNQRSTTIWRTVWWWRTYFLTIFGQKLLCSRVTEMPN